MSDARRRTVQPRHRDRSGSLLGFHHLLDPVDHEWAVDKLKVQLFGDWHSDLPGHEFCSEAVGLPDVNWFNSASSRGTHFRLKTRHDASATIALELVVNVSNDRNRPFKLDLVCNPTKTLAHLIAQIPAQGELLRYISNLPPERFFSKYVGDALERGLDGNSNMIVSPLGTRERLSGSFFDSFLPIYLIQLQALMTRFLGSCDEWDPDGSPTHQIISSINGNFRIRWDEVKVPQVETYFERYHSGAVAAVRRAGMQILAGDHTNRITQYGGNLQMEREANCYSVMMPVSQVRKVVMYAKTPKRIRFEVRRDRKGRYDGLPAPAATLDRLTNILQREKQEAERCCNWREIGTLFNDADGMSFTTLLHFLTTVADVCATTGEPVGKIIEQLLTDGSIADIADDNSRTQTVGLLQSHGVVRRIPLRRRDMRNALRRYALSDEYNDIRDKLLEE